MRKNIKFLTAALLVSTFFTSSVTSTYALGDTEFSSSNQSANQHYTPYYPTANNDSGYSSQDNNQGYGQDTGSSNNSGYNTTSYSQNNSGGYGDNSGGYGQNNGGSYGNNGGNSGGYGQNNGGNYVMKPLQGRISTVPAGTVFSASPHSDITTSNVSVGDTVTMTLGSDLSSGNGAIVLPAGSTIEGNVVIADAPGMTQKAGRLKIQFTNAITPRGRRIPISAKIATKDGSGLLIGETGLNRAEGVGKDAVAGAAAGALFGTALGAITHNVGRGAWAGTAIGGGLGLGKAALDKGNGVIISAGKAVDIVLDRPLTTGSAPTSNYNY